MYNELKYLQLFLHIWIIAHFVLADWIARSLESNCMLQRAQIDNVPEISSLIPDIVIFALLG